MKILERSKLMQKVKNALSEPNEKTEADMYTLPPLILALPYFITFFYEALDRNKMAQHIWEIFLHADETRLQEVHKILVFFFIYHLDRSEDYELLNDAEIQNSLHLIWGIAGEDQKALTIGFDSSGAPFQAVAEIPRLIRIFLAVEDSMTLVIPMVHAAWMRTLVGNQKITHYLQPKKRTN